MTNSDIIKWTTSQHIHSDNKATDWYWALGLIAVSSAVASILFGNILFALLIILAAVSIGLTVDEPGKEHTYTINTRGIYIDDMLYPYKSLEAFWIDESRSNENVLILDAQKPFIPHLVIKIPDSLDINLLQDYLLDYLPEEELYESPAHRLAEIFGF